VPALASRGVLPLLTQPYEGNITIIPPMGVDDLAELLRNPSRARLLHAMGVGERAAWPHISWIRVHCLVERTLDDCVHRVRQRLCDLAASRTASAARGGAAGGPGLGAGMRGASGSVLMAALPSF